MGSFSYLIRLLGPLVFEDILAHPAILLAIIVSRLHCAADSGDGLVEKSIRQGVGARGAQRKLRGMGV